MCYDILCYVTLKKELGHFEQNNFDLEIVVVYFSAILKRIYDVLLAMVMSFIC